MAIANKFAPHFMMAHGWPMVEGRLTTLTAGLEEDWAHGGPTGTGAEPCLVTVQTVVPPTSNDPVLFTWLRDDTSVSGGTIRVKFDTIPGGDLTGAEVQIQVYFPVVKGGGIAAI